MLGSARVPGGSGPTVQPLWGWPNGATSSCPTCSRQPNKLRQDPPALLVRGTQGLCYGVLCPRQLAGHKPFVLCGSECPKQVRGAAHGILFSGAWSCSADTMPIGCWNWSPVRGWAGLMLVMDTSSMRAGRWAPWHGAALCASATAGKL